MSNFSADAPLSSQIRVVENAIVVPWGRGKKQKMARPAGIFTAEGEFCRRNDLPRCKQANDRTT